MAETQFVIAGPVENEEQLWWHNELGWITKFECATTLPKQILTSPLPPGATGIMEITMDWEAVGFYMPLSVGGGHGTMFGEKRC